MCDEEAFRMSNASFVSEIRNSIFGIRSSIEICTGKALAREGNHGKKGEALIPIPVYYISTVRSASA